MASVATRYADCADLGEKARYRGYSFQIVKKMTDFQRGVRVVSDLRKDRLVRSPAHWAARRYAEMRIAGRKARLEAEISRVLDVGVRLQLTGGGGRDSIYYAVAGRRQIGVVRLVNPFKRRPPTKKQPLGPSNLWWALAADRRLNREWEVYSRLAPKRLTPAPVWRTHDAIMCTYFDGQSVSKRLAADGNRYWDLMGSVLHSLRRLHDHGATHMDAKVENILTDAEARQFVFIDFDCTPPKWADPPQQRAYDYLKLIDSSLRLVPPRERENQRRWIGLLERTVDEETRQTNLDLLTQRRRTTRHIMRDPRLCRTLRCVFHRL